MQTLFLPLILALVGSVLRGASFAFRKYAATLRQARPFGAVFANSSVVTPFSLGCVAGAIASVRVPADGDGDLVGSWTSLTSLFGGTIAVGTCAFLAGTFLTADARRDARSSQARCAVEPWPSGWPPGWSCSPPCSHCARTRPRSSRGSPAGGCPSWWSLPWRGPAPCSSSPPVAMPSPGSPRWARSGRWSWGGGSPSTRVCWSTRSPSPMVPVLPPPCRASWSP